MGLVRARGLLPALVIATLTTALLVPSAVAPAADGPHIVDPEGDTQHREFGWEEPTLDVTEVTFGWTANDTLAISVLLPNADTLGPEGTMDPFPGKWTVVDVYWTMNGTGHLARAVWEPGEEARYEAGQGIRIHREAVWETGTDIHGETTEQTGTVEAADGGGHRVTIEVDPAAVGDPGPGDLLEAPAFSTYVDHHFPLGDAWPVPHPVGPHHPANADLNDEPGMHFWVPGAGPSADDGPAAAGGGPGEPVPHVGVVAVVVLAGIVALVRRD